MIIEPLPLLADNYAWLISDDERAAVVDPSEADPVAQAVSERGLVLTTILATHHHWDHTGGIEALAGGFGLDVICSAYELASGRVPAASRGLQDGETFELLGEQVECLFVPGHTLGAVAFYIAGAGALFTGDTLFTAGCGRLFEGDPPMMLASLHRLAQLPPSTQVYCGHEYSEKNLRFAQSVQPDYAPVAERLAQVRAARQRGEATVPAALATELQTNPFLRSDDPALAAAVGMATGVDTFAELRRRRDGF